jgi:ferritin-like metal-binding protein YciE
MGTFSLGKDFASATSTIGGCVMATSAAKSDLNKLFVHTLKDVYYAENAISKALPKMMKAAKSKELQAAFEKHMDETENQVARLEQVFELLGEQAAGVPCEAIKGILKEGDEIAEEFEGSEALDAGLIAAAQAVEHYEIARYRALTTWADELGLIDAAGLLSETLEEEEATDKALTELAESGFNKAAA